MHGNIQLIMPHDGEYGNGRQIKSLMIIVAYLEKNNVYSKKKHTSQYF